MVRVTKRQRVSLRNSAARINFQEGSIRAGKTTAQLILAIEQMVDAPPGPIALVGRTERTLVRNFLRPLQEMIGAGNIHLNRGEGEARILGRLCYLYGASSEAAVDKVLGSTLAGAIGDQIELWPESFTRALLDRMSLPGARLHATLNPQHPTHYLKTDFIDEADNLDMNVEHYTLDDAPFLPRDYVAAIKREHAPVTSMHYRRYILGLWVRAQGAIWEIDRERHFRGVWRRQPVDETWIAIDYGTANPFVALALRFQQQQQRIVVSHEWRWDSRREGKQLSDPEYADALERWIKKHELEPEGFIVDPSAASFRALMRKRGHRVRKAKNDVDDGLRYVSSLLAPTPAMVVFDESLEASRTIAEIDGYTWKDNRGDSKAKDEPVKADDHGPDALRYGVATTRLLWRDWILTGDHVQRAAG